MDARKYFKILLLLIFILPTPSSAQDLPEPQDFPSAQEMLQVMKNLKEDSEESAFTNNLFGQEGVDAGEIPDIPQSLLDNRISAFDLKENWEQIANYRRVIHARFLTASAEKQSLENGDNSFWKTFIVENFKTSRNHISLWKEKNSKRLTLVGGDQSKVHTSLSSLLLSADHGFYKSDEPLGAFQVNHFYNAHDLGDFFDTCVPFSKNNREFLICRDRTGAQRAVQKIRYEVWIKL